MAPRYCLVCGVVDVSPRGVQALYCLGCYAKANRRNGAIEAHRAVRQAVIAGRLAPAKSCVCVDCGSRASSYDHRDYNQPLAVVPVCHSCNKKRGPAIPLGGVGLFTSKQSKFVTPNWQAPPIKAVA